MIERWHKFTDEELDEIRLGLETLHAMTIAWDPAKDPINAHLVEEIEHLQEQRKMAARRAELPG